MKTRQFSINDVTYDIHRDVRGKSRRRDDRPVTVEGPGLPATSVRVRRLDDVTREVVAEDGRWRRLVYTVWDRNRQWVFVNGQVFELTPIDPSLRAASARHPTSLEAPMPATVIRVDGTPGQAVRAGDTLLVLEAMKMELPLKAPRDGVVAEVRCVTGDLVQPGRPLIELKDDRPV